MRLMVPGWTPKSRARTLYVSPASWRRTMRRYHLFQGEVRTTSATIRGTFELIDRASSTLKKIEMQATKTQAAVVGVGAALDESGGKSSGASKAFGTEADALHKVEDASKDARKAVDDLSASHSRLASSTSGSSRSLSSWTAQLRSFLGQKSSMDQMSQAASKVGEAFEGLGSAFGLLKFAGIASAIGPAISSIDALGGALVGLLPALMKAASGIEAFPAGISLMAQAMGTLKLATGGVGAAISALSQQQANYGTNNQQYANSLQSANNTVTTANQGLTAALYAQNQAQIELTATRQSATRTLADMEFAARTSVLSEASAGLNIQQAQQELQQAMMTPGTTQLQLEQDRLGVYQAQADAQQTHTQAVRDRQDYSQAKHHDPSSAVVMQLAQANHAVEQSHQGVANAERARTQAEQALNQTTKTGSAGAQSLKTALDALAPAQRQFVEFLKDSGALKGVKALREASAGGLFPAVEPGITALIKIFPELEAVAMKTGRAMGDAFTGVAKVFADPKWITQVGDKNVSIIKQMGGGFHSLAEIVKDLIGPGQQFISWLVKLADGWLKAKAQQDAGAKGLGMLTEKFTDAEVAIKQIGDVLVNLWDVFRNVTGAASGLGNALWDGADKGTKAWAKWTGSVTGQNDMQKYFSGLLPTLRALDKLFDDLTKAFVSLGNGAGQSQATSFIKLLKSLVPDIQSIVRSTSSWSNALGPALTVFAKISVLLAKIVGEVTKVKPLAEALGLAFAVGLIGRFVAKLSTAGTIMARLYRSFGASRGGLASPGTTGSETTGGVKSLFGNGAKALTLSAQWGTRSSDGPGSVANPFAVMVIEGGAGSLGGSRADDEGSAARSEEGAAARDSEGGVGALERTEGGLILPRGVSPIATGAEDVGDVADVGKLASIGSKLGDVAGAFGKFAGPLGVALTVLPGVIAAFTGKGSVGTRLQDGAAATANAATFGLFHFGGGTTTAGQRTQGTNRGNTFFTGLKMNDAGGLTAPSMAAYQRRINTLQGQYNTAAHGRDITTMGMGGQTYTQNVGQNAAVREDRYAQLTTAKTDLGKLETSSGKDDANKWQQDYADAIQSGQKPAQAMALMEKGLTATLDQLSPDGKRSLDASMTGWASEMAQQNPKLQGVVDNLNSYITTSFSNMGQSVAVVNGQILTGSTQQWSEIETALTNPMDVAQEKLTGAFKKIQQEAVGELTAMGFSKSDASTLLSVGGTSKKALAWDASQGKAAKASSYSGKGSIYGSRAGGGRVPGNDRRDTFAYGGNMLGGGELVVNRHQEMDANARLMRAGEPTLGAIVSGMNKPHWMATGGRTIKAPQIGGSGIPQELVQKGANDYAAVVAMMLKRVIPGGGGGGATNFAGVPGSGGTEGQNQALGRRMMIAAGIPANQWPDLKALWTQESGWSDTVMHNPSMPWLAAGNASGIPQADGHGQVYRSGDARAQIAWGLNYIKSAYHNSPALAEAHELAHGGYARGGRVSDAGWFANGGSFITNGPTVFGAGERGPEKVTVTPANQSGEVTITIHKIEVNRKGDVQRIVDEELQLLANSLKGH
jgi:hypothetical protein